MIQKLTAPSTQVILFVHADQNSLNEYGPSKNGNLEKIKSQNLRKAITCVHDIHIRQPPFSIPSTIPALNSIYFWQKYNTNTSTRWMIKNQRNTYITIFWFPIADAAAKSRGEGKSPKLVNSDHCHISRIYVNAIKTNRYRKNHESTKRRHIQVFGLYFLALFTIWSYI